MNYKIRYNFFFALVGFFVSLFSSITVNTLATTIKRSLFIFIIFFFIIFLFQIIFVFINQPVKTKGSQYISQGVEKVLTKQQDMKSSVENELDHKEQEQVNDDFHSEVTSKVIKTFLNED